MCALAPLTSRLRSLASVAVVLALSHVLSLCMCLGFFPNHITYRHALTRPWNYHNPLVFPQSSRAPPCPLSSNSSCNTRIFMFCIAPLYMNTSVWTSGHANLPPPSVYIPLHTHIQYMHADLRRHSPSRSSYKYNTPFLCRRGTDAVTRRARILMSRRYYLSRSSCPLYVFIFRSCGTRRWWPRRQCGGIKNVGVR